MRVLAKLPKLVVLTGFVTWQLLYSSLLIAWDVLTPRAHRAPGIVAVPLDAETDFEIAAVANLITLTPGTVSIDVSSDRKYLYVHCMFASDPEAVRQSIKTGFERRVLELLR
ncbi:Na+/H+ antiporter subunit E [Haliangium ochraceum]|uniref:Cation antiporter n=1 Tax=Haliangium ochraceum (strain DSM 14365 / JCM 11303 / SMP-2) TaxID=502025 RepID=D0LWA5_HALO1|nr:Na+/H+ antiporter subunit E [Haliangium ochraceum]ACY16037.1 cation antiporter [Haliangium ochraceum DSM 14365]